MTGCCGSDGDGITGGPISGGMGWQDEFWHLGSVEMKSDEIGSGRVEAEADHAGWDQEAMEWVRWDGSTQVEWEHSCSGMVSKDMRIV